MWFIYFQINLTSMSLKSVIILFSPHVQLHVVVLMLIQFHQLTAAVFPAK